MFESTFGIIFISRVKSKIFPLIEDLPPSPSNFLQEKSAKESPNKTIEYFFMF